MTKNNLENKSEDTKKEIMNRLGQAFPYLGPYWNLESPELQQGYIHAKIVMNYSDNKK